MKRILAFVLSLVLLVTTFAVLGTMSVSAAIAPGEVTVKLRENFEDDVLATFEEESDGHLGIPVVLTTFVRDSVDPNGVTILYVVGHKEERIGTDSDEDIINDMLNEGYCVTVLDYLDNPKAIGNEFGWSVHKIFTGGFKSKKYDFGYVRKTHDNMYVVPSGCRIDREIYYFSIDEMALNGTNEYILWLWNTYYAGSDGIYKDENGNDLPYAETIDDMIKPDGSPIDFDLRMDVVYPSNPKETVPVYALASSAEERTMSLSSAVRPYFTTAVLQGYAGVIYDHEYIPMSRQDHYKYYGNYTLGEYSSFTLGTTNANAVHSAAIRKIRYMADDFGYDGDYIAAWGFSKSGLGPAILANTKHEEMGEILDFGEYVPEGKDPKGYQGEQPWLYYEDTDTPISSNITVAYSGSGAGICQYRERLMTEDSVPIVSSIGTADTTGNFYTYIPAAKKYLDSHPEIESDFVIAEGLDHNPAYGHDSVKQIEMFNEIWGWLDNHIRAAYREEAPVVLWATPSSNTIYESLEESVVVKFSRAMDIESVKENLKVIRLSDGKEVGGTWEVWHGATTFRFASPSIINGSSYKILVGAETKAKDGVKIGIPFSKVFTISGDKLLQASADTYVSSAQPDKNFGSEGTLITQNNATEHSKGLLSFTNAGGFKDVTKAYLVLNRFEDTYGDIAVYGTSDFDENTVTYNTAPANGEKLASKPVTSEITTIDVTDYVMNMQGDIVNFALESTKENVYLHQTFDNIVPSDLVYDVDYRYGGGTATMSISSDAKVGSTSAYFTDRAQNDNRIKFLKSFGTDKLTDEYLGLTVKASFWIKSATAEYVTVGVYEHKALSGVHTEIFKITPGEWNYIEYVVTVDQEMIDGNIRAITVVPSGKDDYWLDDFKSELLTGSVTLGTKEYNGEKPKISANLVLFTPESSAKTGSAAVIGSGESADTVLGADASVSGILEERTNGTQKGYIKFPISEFNLDADSINLKFEASSSNTAEFSVYGVLADDSKFAENFTTGITWNTALGNDTETNGVDASETVLIDKVTVTGTETVSLDVKDYVTAMADDGYDSVTFIIVKDNANRTVSNVTFENMPSYSAYVKNATMALFDVGVTTDPTDSDNGVLYFDKSGDNGGAYSGYAQNVSLTGLIQSDDTFDQSDIGKKYKVSFRIYAVTPEGTATVGNYCNISSVNAATTGTLINGVTKSVSSSAANQWNTVTFDITVTSDMVSKNATAIILATGWVATRVYVDDIVVEENVGDLSITLNAESENKNVTFDGITEYKNVVQSAGMTDYGYGITADPADSTNKVFYFDRGVYAHSISFTGLISPTDKFRTSDVGKTITVTYRHYNYRPDGTTAVLGTIDKAGNGQYFLTTGVTRYVDDKVSLDTGSYGLTANTWHNVKFVIEVTEEMVGNSCAIVVASNAAVPKIYIDDIVVTVEGGPVRTVPTLEVTTGSTTVSSVYTDAAVINGGAKDTSYGQQYDSMAIVKTSSGAENGLKKTYVSFDKSGYYHVIAGKLSFKATGKAGYIINIYAVNTELSVSGLTWNNAYGNDIASVGVKAGQVYGGAPIASVTLGGEDVYTVDVSDALIEYEKNESVTFILATEEGTAEITLSDIVLDISSTIYTDGEVKAEMDAPVVNGDDIILAVDYAYRVDYMVEKVEFFIDGQEAATGAVVNGQITKANVKNLAAGNHTVYAVVTYTDGKVIASDTVGFSVEAGNDVVYGDLDESGKVDTGDLAALKLFLAGGAQDEINMANADVDGSGKVDTTDLATLKLFLAGANDKLGPQ